MLLNRFLKIALLGLLLGRRDRQHRSSVAAGIDAAAFVDRIEVRVQLIKLALRERVVLVVVAATAADGQTEPHSAGCFSTINDVIDARLFRDATALSVEHVIAMKACRDELIRRRIFEQVTGELFDRKSIKRHIFIKGFDDPVAPWPECSRPVLLIAVRVGVTSGVEPAQRHVLAEAFRSEQPVDDLFERVC